MPTFDLRSTTFFPPEALLSLAAAARFWYETTGQPVTWKLDNPDTLLYLERMDVFSVFADCIVAPELPTNLWSRTSSSKLIEVHPISPELEQNNLVDVPRLILLAQELLLGRVTPERMGAACSLLSEVAQNIVHCGISGFALAQVYSMDGFEMSLESGTGKDLDTVAEITDE